MYLRKFAISLAMVVAAGSMSTGIAMADDTPGTTLYVDNSKAYCSDSGPGTAAAPFCTIQAAANVAEPGQTVLVDPGTPGEVYHEDVTVTRSGTPGDPITFEAGVPVNTYSPQVSIAPAAGQTLNDGFNLSGVHDITINGFGINGTAADGVSITGSSDITVNRDGIGLVNPVPAGVVVSGASSNVMISRTLFDTRGDSVSIGSGASDVTVSTNRFDDSPSSPSVAVTGATDTAITSNTAFISCATDITVAGSTGTTIENNAIYGVCGQTTAAAEISVDAPSAPSTTLDYNMPFRASGTGPLYSWAGSGYNTVALLTLATGQGAHDLNANPGSTTPTAAATDSADADAPGELSTDLLGRPRLDDPLVADTGTGVGYYDRGSLEAQDPLQVASMDLSASQAPTGGVVTASPIVTSAWAPSGVTGTVDFGDGSTPTPISGLSASVSHTYTTPGRYTVTTTVTDSLNTTASATQTIIVVAPAPLQPVAAVVTDSALSMTVDADGTTDSWSIKSVEVDFGDGQSESSNSTVYAIEHTYAKSGAYTITETITDAGGNTQTVTEPYSTLGSDYTPYGPVRLLDTRNGVGTGGKVAKIPANGVLKLQVAGNGAIPAGVTAVAVNLTTTDTTGTGLVIAYADGTAEPNVSNLNYTPGVTAANSAIIPVSKGGYIDLSNRGTTAGPIDLIVDVTGYFDLNGIEGYSQVVPDRLLDTREGHGQASPNVPVKLTVAGADGGNLPADGITAVALNVTATNTHGTGNLTVYPDGQDVPTASNLNFTAGRTVANSVIVPVGSDGAIDLDLNGTTVGPADLIVDVTGYFSADNPNAYVPVTPTRLLDTRNTTALGPNATAVTVAALTGTTDVVNVTVTEPTGTGFITAYSGNPPAPDVSTVNYTPGATVANLALVIPGGNLTDPTGVLGFFNGGTTAGTVELIVDEFGYFAS
jgi:PKD repeat protein